MATGGNVRAIAGLLHDTWIEYQRDRARYFAVAIIYYAAICLVPLLLLLLSTLGLLLRYSATAVELEREMLTTIETRFGSQLSEMITRLLDGLQHNSIVVTIIGVLGMLVAASLLFRHLRMTFRAVWHYEPPTVAGPIRLRVFTIIREWIIAFVITLGGGGLLLLGVVVIAAFRWLRPPPHPGADSPRRRDTSGGAELIRARGDHLRRAAEGSSAARGPLARYPARHLIVCRNLGCRVRGHPALSSVRGRKPKRLQRDRSAAASAGVGECWCSVPVLWSRAVQGHHSAERGVTRDRGPTSRRVEGQFLNGCA
jgi:hypothetical protein